MMNTRLLLLPLLASLAACGPKSESPAGDKPAPAPEKQAPAPAEAPPKAPESAAAMPAGDQPFPQAVDINGFGSDEVVPRADMPARGIIRLTSADWQFSNGAHWDTYTGASFKARRWGKYEVMLTYILRRGGIGSQFRMGDLIVKKQLASAQSPRTISLGTLYIPAAGDLPFTLLTPPTEQALVVREITLIPACEGETPRQAADGAITLHAKDATTWSENMRYEPKPEKNCLGFWTEPDDIAEWEFEVTKPGRYKVVVHHGCGGGNHGSEVEVRLDGQSLKFTTRDTGGFQSWQPVEPGEIEIRKPGKNRLVIDPVNKVKNAVLDVHKVELVPVG
ncbi:MAG TPA: hypothetical protein PK490_03900 [Prosthecobacter sp.]|nr:hypothetical protein [Prosthecobacter sp.]HRK13406.1 hypothetical protein [Prosthecobacter sp.]